MNCVAPVPVAIRAFLYTFRLLCRDASDLASVSSSGAAIVSKTLVGVITSWNAGATNMFGYQADEMIGQPITRVIPLELQREEEEILRQIQRGGRIKNYETVRLTKNGGRIDISLTVSPILDFSGEVMGASKVARDVTAERRAEAELQQVPAELARVACVTTLGEMTAAIAHEVNQPLAAIVSSGMPVCAGCPMTFQILRRRGNQWNG